MNGGFTFVQPKGICIGAHVIDEGKMQQDEVSKRIY
jgi:hypothetical protein